MNYDSLPYNLKTLKQWSSEVQEFGSSDDTIGRYCLPYNLITSNENDAQKLETQARLNLNEGSFAFKRRLVNVAFAATFVWFFSE
jgi:hypothetical protein